MTEGREGIEPVHLPRPAVGVRRWSWRLVGAVLLVGGVSAAAAVGVRQGFRGLQWVLTGSSADPPGAAASLWGWRRAMTPVVGALLAIAVLWVREALAGGGESRQAVGKTGASGAARLRYVEYVEAVRHRGGMIPLGVNVWRTGSAACSVASGAAVGREGSMIQFAAMVASALGRLRGWWLAREDGGLSFLVACGVAGGVTVAYNAPVGATLFAAEIVLGGVEWRELLLLGMAAGVGWVVNGLLEGFARLYPVRVELGWNRGLLWLPVLALGLGVAGPAYQGLLKAAGRLRRLPLAMLWSGAVVGACSLVDPRVWGNGDAGLRSALGIKGAAGLARLLGLRLLATTACVGTGTVGGVFTPTLFAGGAVGALLGRLVSGGVAGLGMSTGGSALAAVVGMSCFLAAVTHAPLMAAFVGVELTGDWRLWPLLAGLNFVAFGGARRISPRAMYAIASQAPTAGPLPGMEAPPAGVSTEGGA